MGALLVDGVPGVGADGHNLEAGVLWLYEMLLIVCSRRRLAKDLDDS